MLRGTWYKRAVYTRKVVCARCGDATVDRSHAQRKRHCSYKCAHAERDDRRQERRCALGLNTRGKPFVTAGGAR